MSIEPSQKLPCLLLHGFTGGPFELQPLADYLRSSGRSCEVPRLPWHGEDLAQLKTGHWTKWIQSAEWYAERMSAAYGSFDIIGFSMGGLLAAYIAARYPVRKLILLNASVVYISPSRLLKVIHERWKHRDVQDLDKVKSTPIRATWQFTRIVRHLRPELTKVRVPTFIAQSEQDHVIHPLSARYIYNKLGGYRELSWFPKSRHLICLSDESVRLFHEVDVFLEKECGGENDEKDKAPF
ncbi:alpha/beta hydrolase [Paenibacillus eucommiae]|uniref:Esterase/lipase n=1 Tax=Paenibacillus eucommiae TaxID=1355755 RepID=A0ABS4J5T2_9BACL|nr:alpha/beta fold hydrolase [Paenibacillus eucommiae]MBP1995197.1 esterase/lipase [Paenibacillus eucommiae]